MKKNSLILILTFGCFIGLKYLINVSGEELSKYQLLCLYMIIFLSIKNIL